MVYTQQGPCPCGKGKYTRAIALDGGGNEQEVVIMHCKECKNKYSWGVIRKAFLDNDDEWGWVKKEGV